MERRREKKGGRKSESEIENEIKREREREKFDVELTTLSLLIYRRYPSTLRALVRARSLARRPPLHSRAYTLTNTIARVYVFAHTEPSAYRKP